MPFNCTDYLPHPYMYICIYGWMDVFLFKGINSLIQVSICFGNFSFVRLLMDIHIYNATLSKLKLESSSNFYSLSFQISYFQTSICILFDSKDLKKVEKTFWLGCVQHTFQPRGLTFHYPWSLTKKTNQLIITGKQKEERFLHTAQGRTALN